MRFAYLPEFAATAVAEALSRRGWDVTPHESPGELIVEGRADIVLTSPLEYARSLGVLDLAMAPGIGISTEGFAGLVTLVFNKGLVDLHTMSVKGRDAYEAAIARVILSEKHDIEPTIVQAAPDASLEDMLAVADMALLVGDDAVFGSAGGRPLLDLTDEWGDVNETPLPYRLFWGGIDKVPQEALDDLIAARDEAVLMLPDLALRSGSPGGEAFYQRYLRGEIRYSLGAPDLSALDACYRYLFYYGLITDIPALRHLPDGAPAGDAPAQTPPSEGAGSAG